MVDVMVLARDIITRKMRSQTCLQMGAPVGMPMAAQVVDMFKHVPNVKEHFVKHIERHMEDIRKHLMMNVVRNVVRHVGKHMLNKAH